MSSEDEDIDVIFDDEEEEEEISEDTIFSEEEDSSVDRVIYDENGINEDFDREEVLEEVNQ